MLETAALVAISALAALALGLAPAAALRRRDEGPVALLADALPWGLLAAALGATMWIWLGAHGAGLAIAGWLAAAVIGVLRLRRHGLRGAPLPRARILLAAWALLAAVAVLMRLREVEFLPWIGDMGAYVNWANELARTGEFSASWPPLLPVLLGLSSAAFGIAHTTAVVAVCGIATLTTTARLVQRLGGGAGMALAATAVAAVHPHLVWYAVFPSSEALNAPLFLLWAQLAHQTLRSGGRAAAGAAAAQAVVVLGLSLLRGSGILLVVPVIAVLVLALVVRAWRPLVPGALLTLAATIAGAGAGYWYGIGEIPRYFVDTQITGLAPGPVVDLLERLTLLEPGLASAAVILVPTAALALLALRRGAPRGAAGSTQPAAGPAAGRGATVSGALLAGALVLGVAACLVVGTETAQILLRTGLWLVAGMAAGLVAVLRLRDGATALAVALLGGSTLVFIALHTVRLLLAREHSFYLYWDRYIVSEALPAMIVVSALGLALVPWRRLPRLAATAAAAAVAIATALTATGLVVQLQRTEMDGAVAFTQELDALVADRDEPVLWSSSDGREVADFGFPNTWMAFAVPLRRTFALDVVNSGQHRDNFAPDEVLDARTIADYLACRPGAGVATVLELRGSGVPLPERLAEDGIPAESLGGAEGAIALLHQPVGAGWDEVPFAVDAWRVEAAGLPVGECPRHAEPLDGAARD
ncbi:hypothetical protein [Homoserinibacter sp. YIM 151385]|uniref:hypothetical protein n=1 Tax=Homoserinibacter sp. YIM 151385 TaxID=2985506 RepID=UPI0022F13608|nr:hypothetical protein [Homoserinibacter sp. YIM 151385]WBU37781.1 hypothetical protein OF852_12805 [Homoserinibacter sp. YIM 151385]